MSRQYLLDTNICINLLHKKFNVKERIEKVGIENCHVSDMTMAELYYGAYNSEHPKKEFEEIGLIGEMFHSIPMDMYILKKYGELKSGLRKIGQLIDNMDLFIGSTAIVYNMTLVTENTKHLRRLPIEIENWVVRE